MNFILVYGVYGECRCVSCLPIHIMTGPLKQQVWTLPHLGRRKKTFRQKTWGWSQRHFDHFAIRSMFSQFVAQIPLRWDQLLQVISQKAQVSEEQSAEWCASQGTVGGTWVPQRYFHEVATDVRCRGQSSRHADLSSRFEASELHVGQGLHVGALCVTIWGFSWAKFGASKWWVEEETVKEIDINNLWAKRISEACNFHLTMLPPRRTKVETFRLWPGSFRAKRAKPQRPLWHARVYVRAQTGDITAK